MMIAWPKTRRPDHLLAAPRTVVEPLAQRQHPAELVLPLGQTPQAVLDDDHRAVDDQAEVDARRGSSGCR